MRDGEDRVRSAQRLGKAEFQRTIESGHRAVVRYRRRQESLGVAWDCVRGWRMGWAGFDQLHGRMSRFTDLVRILRRCTVARQAGARSDSGSQGSAVTQRESGEKCRQPTSGGRKGAHVRHRHLLRRLFVERLGGGRTACACDSLGGRNAGHARPIRGHFKG